MDEEPGTPSDITETLTMPHKRLRKSGKYLYITIFLLTLAVTAIAIMFSSGDILLLTVPILVVLGLAIFTDRKYVHVPPVLILLMVGTFALSLVGRMFTDSEILVAVATIFTGINYGLLGLIMVFILLRSSPGIRDENTTMVTFMVMAISVAMFTVLKMLQYFISQYWSGMESVFVNTMMWELLLIMIGSFLVCLLYYTDSNHDIFRHTINTFLEENSELLGIEEHERAQIRELIKGGESERLEFKSTLRTNLQTGEPDKRMEKVVLKTIVAFLNTSGGNLLIGVSDDGTICGVDVEGFDNRDKMGLHLTNLISSQIGNGFLPYISFDMIDFEDGKIVIRVKCLVSPKPVFLKDGKVEIFYVRSGPSSVELTGMNLINYVNNRREEMVRKGRVFE